jgi:hypothetical protein
MGNAEAAVLERITDFYLKSHDFNGMPVPEVAEEFGLSDQELAELLAALVGEDKASLIFGDVHPNPHIRALPDHSIELQLGKIPTSELNQACVYPTAAHLKSVVKSDEYAGRPYTLCLALGEPQLAFRAFDLSVLEIYRNDPRYLYSNDDVDGLISVRDAYYENGKMMVSDQVLLQSFGFCHDPVFNRGVAVFLRYLYRLSPEHQQIWRAKELKGEYRVHPDYYRMATGARPQGMSMFSAFLVELDAINVLSVAMGRPGLFRKVFSMGDRPAEFGFLVRPTLKEFNNFVHLLDKMVSENINRDFFQNEVAYEWEEKRPDGRVVVRQKRFPNYTGRMDTSVLPHG